MNYLYRHSLFWIGPLVLVSGLAVVQPVWAQQACTTNNDCLANETICQFRHGSPKICAVMKLFVNSTTPAANSVSYNVDTNAQGFTLYSCLGQQSVCSDPTIKPSLWTNYGFDPAGSFNPTISGLRSGRTYTTSFFGQVNTGIAAATTATAITWPGYQTAPTVSGITDTQATISWNTPFTADGQVTYSQNPPNWELEPIIAQGLENLADVSALSDGTAWAVGNNGKIAKRPSRASGSAGWFSQTSGSTGFFTSVDAFDANNVWVAGLSGTVDHTTNGGTTWTTTILPGNPSFYAIYSARGTTAWAVGDNGTVFFYTGSSWVQKNIPGGAHLRSVVTLDDTTVWVSGFNGTVMRTIDGGQTWTSVTTNTTQVVSSITTLDGITLWAGGSNGTMIKSTNAGLAWANVNIASPFGVSAIHQVDQSELWFVNDNQVGHMTGGGAQFTYYPEPGSLVGTYLTGLAVATGSEVMVVGQLMRIPSFSLCHPSPGTCAVGGGIQTASGTGTTHSVQLSPLAAGTPYYFAVESDGFGVASGAFGQFTTTAPDTIPPTISFTNPSTTPLTTKISPFPVTGTASDNIGVQSVTLLSDRTGGQTVTGTTAWSASVPLQLGSNILSATARDSTNQTTATTTIVYDNQAPTVTITAPTASSTVSATPTTVSGTAADSVSGNSQIVTMEYSLNGGARQSLSMTPGVSVSWSTAVGNLVLGNNTNTVVVYAQDAAGNEGSASVVFGYQQPTFTLTAGNSPQTRNAGDVVTYPLTLKSVNSFVGAVDLAASGLPAGSSVGFTPTPVNLTANATATSTMTITTNTTTTGTFTMTITGTNGSLSATTTVQLTLNPAPDFTLSSAPGVQNIIAGNPTSYQITAAANTTFAGTVTFQPVTGLPSGANGNYNAPSVALTAGQSKSVTLTITTQTSTPDGSYTLTVTGGSGLITRVVTINLNIAPPPDLNLTIVPNSQSVVAGGPPKSYNGTAVAVNGFNELTTLSVAVVPNDPNIAVTLNITQITPQMWAVNPSQPFVVNAATTSAVPAGTYRLDVTATSATVNKVVPVNLVVAADATPPVITNILATPNFDSVRITWKTDESANDSYIIYTDASQTIVKDSGGSVNNYTTAHNVFSSGLAPLTTYYFSVQSCDQSPAPAGGNCTTVTKQNDNVTPLQFTTLDAPDLTPPTVFLDTPADQADIVGTTQITGHAADNKSVAQIFLKIVPTGPTVPPCVGAACNITTTPICLGAACSFSYTWDTLTKGNGQYLITAQAQDNSGNSSVEVSRTVTVSNDTTAPNMLFGPVAEGLFCDTNTANPTPCQVTIHWQTDDLSTSEVDFGLTSSYGAKIAKDDDPTNSGALLFQDHHVTLKNLLRVQLYHYQVTSCNISSVCTN